MIKTNHVILTTASTLMLLLAGCSTTQAPVLAPAPVVVPKPLPANNTVGALSSTNYNQAVDLSQKNESFHSGMNDGCSTAKGKYIKSSDLYNNDPEYKEGWFHGRRQCQPHRA